MICPAIYNILKCRYSLWKKYRICGTSCIVVSVAGGIVGALRRILRIVTVALFVPTGHTPTMPACDTNAAQTRSQFIPRCPRRPRRPGSRGLALTGRALDTLDTGHSDRRTGFHFRKGQISALCHGHGQKNAGNAGNDPSPGSYGPRQVFYRGGCMKPARSMDVPLGWC